MKSDYAGRATESPVVPKKTCHACGQQIPLKTGDVVEGHRFIGDPKVQGIVRCVAGNLVHVTTFQGKELTLWSTRLTRLHGYYRITEREKMA